MQQLAWLALAGAMGTLARYGLSTVVQQWTGTAFPWGTFIVNLCGCFSIGLVWTLAEQNLVLSAQTRFIVLTGFIGAFTTFSTYAFQTVELMERTEWLFMAANVLGQNVLGIVAVITGLAIGRAF